MAVWLAIARHVLFHSVEPPVRPDKSSGHGPSTPPLRDATETLTGIPPSLQSELELQFNIQFNMKYASRAAQAVQPPSATEHERTRPGAEPGRSRSKGNVRLLTRVPDLISQQAGAVRASKQAENSAARCP